MKKFVETVIKNGGEFFGVNENGKMTYEIQGLKSSPLIIFGDWISPEDHQAEVGKIELQNLKYREEIARMQKSLRKKNKAIKELNAAVKKNKARLKECEDLRIEANNDAAMEFSRKCEVVEERAELKREIADLKSQLEKQQPEIPEVPLFVALWLNRKPLYAINGSIPVEIIEWSRKQTGYADLGMNISHLLKLKVNGYTVAKEKRFYLKHIEMSKRDVHHDYYAQIRNERFEHDSVESDMFPQPVITGVTFTQQEIDSMETGSYEQIEVEE